jgi:murein DD-endopeptidase MepM/ murein hydrolase activator NlpD
LVRRVLVGPALLGLGIATTFSGSAIAYTAGGTQALAVGAINAAATDTAAAQAAAARAESAELASRQVASRSAVSLAQGQKEERARAEAAARKAAAERKAKALKAKRLAAAHRWVMPIKHPNLTSRFGPRWGRLHAGLDFGAPVGTSLFAMSSGVVTKAGNGGGYGNKIEITYWDGTVSYFAHMSEIDVKVGQQVRPGTYVGKSGNTGQSTGPHLHLEMHPKGRRPGRPDGVAAEARRQDRLTSNRQTVGQPPATSLLARPAGVALARLPRTHP